MSTSSIALPAARRRPRALSLPVPAPEIGALLVLAAVLYLWALDRNGFANEYYSAAVRSMSSSWHAFLYGSFDASGIMTVDKPPLALWAQALSARIFGFSSWSLLVPQALMGVATVGLAYDLTRRQFGRVAGFTAGLALVLTPITVAIARHNNPDALLALCCTAALWCVVRAFADGRTRWLVLAGVAVGLGFEAKMAAALLVVPAIAAAWLWIAPRGRGVAVRQLLAGGAAMTVVGLAWPLLMWLTPAADRPWISGTSDNSIWSLIFGYNGLGRLFGQSGGPGGGAGGPGGGGGFGGNGLFGGEPGPLRLLNEALGGQAGWLLGVALVGGAGLLAVTRLRRADPRSAWLVLVGGAFLTTAVAFSKAEGIFHPYYVAQLAPLTAALVGAIAALILGRGTIARIVGPAAVFAGVVTEIAILHDNPTSLSWWPGPLAAGGVLAAVGLALVLAPRMRALVVAAAIAVLLLAPGAWAVQTLGHATNGTFPSGGPATTAFGGGMGGPAPGGAGTQGGGFGAGGGMFGGDTSTLSEAIAYAKANGGGTIAIASQTAAEGSLITSGANVVGIGGFSGRESQVTTEWLADAVESGKIRY
ncbi:MAG TPA: glycosyltransferase family 39 protein, partial [Solirubrobacteraceae bacterium]